MKAISSILFLFLAAGITSGQTAQPPPVVATGNADPYLDLPGYLAERTSALAIRARNFDPFGRPKDPSRTPPPKKDPELPTPNQNPVSRIDPKIAFEEAVAGLKAKVIMAGENQFTMEGGTTLRKGDYFTLSSPKMTFKVQVRSATAGLIRLQETDKGNFADIVIDAMPSGMSRGGQALMPGQPTNSPEILKIESPKAP